MSDDLKGDALADFIRDQVCCPRPQGCEAHCYPESCPAEMVRRALAEADLRAARGLRALRAYTEGVGLLANVEAALQGKL